MNAQHENAAKNPLTAQLQADGLQGGSLSATRPGEQSGTQLAANASPQVQQLKAIHGAANERSQPRQLKAVQNGLTATVQRAENKTGLPDQLKSGVEGLSGMAMDDVKVHYNSDKPAQMQAHAYAQGTDIHVAPGQEKHVPHEAWHVVQQKQGRVQATTQLKGKVAVNDDAGLENEADVMGAKAMQMKATEGALTEKNMAGSVAQRVENEEAESDGSEGLDPEIMAVADMLEEAGEPVTVESLEAAMESDSYRMESGEETLEMESDEASSEAPVQRAKSTPKPRKKKIAKGIKKQSKTTKYRARKRRAQRFVMPKKGSRYGGHDSTGNKHAILEVINYRQNNLPKLNLSKLSLPEETTANTQGFGKQNVLNSSNMYVGTAICHKLAESEVFKSIDTMIDQENISNVATNLEYYLTQLIDYIDPKHITNDNAPGGGAYEDEVNYKFQGATTAFGKLQLEAIGNTARKLLAHEVGKNVVNSPVNLFNGSSSVNSSIQEHLDGNKYEKTDGTTPLTPRSQRAKNVQSQFPLLIEGPKKGLFTNNEMSSSLL